MGATFLALRSGLPHLGLLATPLACPHCRYPWPLRSVSKPFAWAFFLAGGRGAREKTKPDTPLPIFETYTDRGGGYTKTN